MAGVLSARWKKLPEVGRRIVHYPTRAGEVSAAEDVSLEPGLGEGVSPAGESGYGKTTLAVSLAKRLPENAPVIRKGWRLS